MDDARFDDLARSLAPASSRRRLAAGLAGGLLALAAPWFGSTTEIAEARKKKRRRKRRRCRPRCGGGHVCKRGRCVCPRGDKPCGGACIPANRCCDDGDCPDIEPVCCRGACLAREQCCTDEECSTDAEDKLACCEGACRGREGRECDSAGDCCSRRCRFSRCQPCHGKPCQRDLDCCEGVACEGNLCGGCRDAGVACGSTAQCCFSECRRGLCLSLTGGRCRGDFDCRLCYLGPNADQCDGGPGSPGCHAGRCTCPTECCFNEDCFPGYACQNGRCRIIIGK